MAFRVRYHTEVKSRDIPRLGGSDRDRVKHAIETRLMVEPQKYGLPLRQNLKGYWKLRVGDYRIVFTVEGEEVFILIICHRKNVYDRAARRA